MESRAPKPNSAESLAFKDATGRNTGWNIAFGLLMAMSFFLFARWGLDYIGSDANIPIFFLATIFGLFMAFNIGGNDVANSFGTSVGAGTLTIKQALLIAAVFEVSGAIIAGGEVTDTVRSGIVDLDAINLEPNDFMLIMMSSVTGCSAVAAIRLQNGVPVCHNALVLSGALLVHPS